MATDTRTVAPGDPYVDPPRDWRRVGVLAGGLVVLWIVVGALGWIAMQVPALGPDSQPQGTNETAKSTLYWFLSGVYKDRDAGKAQEFVCDRAGAPSAEAFLRDIETLEAKSNRNVQPEWEPIQVGGSGAVANLSVIVGFSGEKPREKWAVTAVDDGGWCIASITPGPVPGEANPSPGPSRSGS